MSKQQENICPLCQKVNYCQVASIEACWCSSLSVPEALIKQLPKNIKNKRCICKACVEAFLSQQNTHSHEL